MIIKYNGAKVFPPIIERVILQSGAVSKCSVVGIQDKLHSIGMEPIAFVVLNKYADAERIKEGLKDLCKKDLPDYAQPIDFVFIDALPLTPIGKIDYRALEKQAEEKISK